jgi:hypothetical protein
VIIADDHSPDPKDKQNASNNPQEKLLIQMLREVILHPCSVAYRR